MADPAARHLPRQAPIDSYGKGGFAFADMSHRGSILALPTGVRAIAAISCADIDSRLIDQILTESG